MPKCKDNPSAVLCFVSNSLGNFQNPNRVAQKPTLVARYWIFTDSKWILELPSWQFRVCWFDVNPVVRQTHPQTVHIIHLFMRLNADWSLTRMRSFVQTASSALISTATFILRWFILAHRGRSIAIVILL